MSSIYFGRNASIGLGKEVTWGTAVARSAWRPLMSGSLQRTITKTPRPHLLSGGTSAMRRGHFTEADECGGTFQVEAQFTSIGILLEALMGSSASTGSGPYVHTYSMASTLPSLTAEFVRGTGSSEILEGAKLSTGTLAVSSGGVMTFESEIIAETSAEGTPEGSSVAPRSARGTASYGTDAPILHSHAGQLNFDSNNYDLIDMSLVVNNGIARRQLLGSAITKEPLRSDFQSVELSCTLEVQDALYMAMVADTTGNVTISFSPSGSTNDLALTLHNCYISTATDPVSAAGVVSQSLTFVAESDGTNEGLSIAVTNGNSSAITGG